MKKLKIFFASVFLLAGFSITFFTNTENVMANDQKHYSIDCESFYGTHCSGEGGGCIPKACNDYVIQ